MSSTSRAKLSLGTRRTDKRVKTGRYHHQRSRSWAPVADGECRLGATGLMVFEAARQGDLENLQFLMGLPEARENINHADRDGQTPLMAAAKNGHFDCVKLLICNSAIIVSDDQKGGLEASVSMAAEQSGHHYIAKYLRGCIDDLLNFKTTRAHMEHDVTTIASTPGCSNKDLQEFLTLLRLLIKHCDYNINGETELDIPLLIQAVRADNEQVVYRLIGEFGAQFFANDPATGETALHIACKNKSDLRFYLVQKKPELLKCLDIEGITPLHIACGKDDVEFVSWLFVVTTHDKDEGGADPMEGSTMPRTRSVPQMPHSKIYTGSDSSVCSIQPKDYQRITPRIRKLPTMNGGPFSDRGFMVSLDRHLRTPKSGIEELVASFHSGTFNASGSTNDSSFEFSEESDVLTMDQISFEAAPDPRITRVYPLTIQEIIDLKPFGISMKGESILHIIAQEGFTTLLTIVLNVARYLKHSFQEHKVDLGIFTRRDGFTRNTPLDEAIQNKRVECVKLLMQFASEMGILGDIIADCDLLKNAAFSNNVEIMKTLIRFGLYKGLDKAISLASIQEYYDILRLLLFYHTEVQNVLEFSRVQRNGTVTLKTGGIKWEGLQTAVVQSVWLYDAYNAVDSVAKALNDEIVLEAAVKGHTFFQRLGEACLQYFNETSLPMNPSSFTPPIIPIVEVNLSENQLESVPSELFQMPSLQVLKLSHNSLTKLPTSEDLNECPYTAPKLKKLNLDWNKLRTLPDSLFFGLCNSLEELSVQANRLHDLPPGIWVAPKLRKLLLSRNNLSRLHRFSSPRYFNDSEFTRKVVGSFMVEGGSLKKKDDECSDELQGMETYIKQLGAFCHILHRVQGTALDQSHNVYQEVIDVHWVRFQQPDQPSQTPLENSVKVEEEVAPDEEDCGCEKNYSNLHFLDLSRNKFTKVPWDLPCIAPKLQRLDMKMNLISDFDIVHSFPANLSTLFLDSNRIVNTTRSRLSSLPCGNPLRLLSLPNDGTSLYCEHCKHQCLDNLSNLTLSHNRLQSFPVVDIIDVRLPEDPEIPSFDNIMYQPYFPNLSILSLEHNQLCQVPQNLHHLVHLSSLTLSHNYSISELPLEMGLVNPQALLVLKLEGMFIKNVPQKLLDKPVPRYLISYLKSLLQKSKPYRRIKLMIVGAGNKGKTSLLLNLTKKGRMVLFKEVELGYNNRPLATVGVDLGDWEYAPRGRNKVTFMTWDFGGQEEYYATHQCFLTSRSLYILVWSLEDGVAGLHSLRPWLENIEGRAPQSPVIVIGTHLDSIPSNKKTEVLTQLKTTFKELYIDYNTNTFSFPRIEPRCLMVNCYDNKQMDSLRDYIYDFVMRYKPPGPKRLVQEMPPLLEQLTPEVYIKLHDIVRSLTLKCSLLERIPIYTRKEYITEVFLEGFTGKIDELEQATNFLHDNGILLHYEDSQLSDLYFVDPQWLCSMLAKVVTVQERNPFQKNGFMMLADLKQTFGNFSLVTEFTTLMQKFEVVLMLDEYRMLIPSLLPTEEQRSCIVFPKSVSLSQSEVASFDELRKEVPVPMCQIPQPLYVRYYSLPFIPNGFFPRLIARVLGSEIIDRMRNSICVGPFGETHVLNIIHWLCWRNGIVMIWNQMEIFRIAPITFPLPGTTSAQLLSCSGKKEVETQKGLEIKVAVLPEDKVTNCSIVRNTRDIEQVPERAKCLASWLLHQATDLIDSVFNDWYEGFALKKGFEIGAVQTTNPCPQCLKKVLTAEIMATASPVKRRITFGLSFIKRPAPAIPKSVVLYLFSSPYCSLAVASGIKPECPAHGEISVAAVAPDLVFSDFAPSMLFMNPEAVLERDALGEGGFGTVHRGSVNTTGEIMDIAIKSFCPKVDPDAPNAAEVEAWEIYHNASVEARLMCQLNHPHVLGLIGITFQPLRLLLELAPLGDLKFCVKKFQRSKVRLSRRTLKATMIQVAEALDYLHSKKIVYRDLKPGNVLVWKFPLPSSQWNSESTVCVKLADYGVSRQVSPQGLRGIQGTPAYLPPEVMLHGREEGYSTKMDVYSFGMFMYYLFTFLNPFENDHRPLTALLEEGRRPELAAKYHPTSLQMFELMCWCWSDKPHHRPDFQVVLEVMRTDAFTQLLAATAVTKDEDEPTAACIRTTSAPRRRSSIVGMGRSCSLLESSIPSLGIMSLMSSTTAAEETSVEIWYGTHDGALGILQYQQSGMTTEIIESQSKKYISSMCVACGNIWVSTVGTGLRVYDPVSKQPIAVWGEQEKHQMYLLLHVEETFSILALTHKGMFVFDTDLPTSMSCDVLTPTHSFPRPEGARTTMKEGAVIPAVGNLDASQVWVCSQAGEVLRILHAKNFKPVEEVPIPEVENSHRRKIRHMVPLTVAGRCFLAFADQHIVQKWDVEDRRKTDVYDCRDACMDIYGGHVRSCRVTSILASNDLLYVGTGGGVMITLNSSTMEVCSVLHAYTEAVRCLLLISPGRQVKPFMRLFSRKDSNTKSPKTSVTSMSSLNLKSSDELDPEERSVLVSFGKCYRGVVGDTLDHPPTFSLPGENGPSVNYSSPQRLAKPKRSVGYLLLLSAEGDPQKGLCCFDELEEYQCE